MNKYDIILFGNPKVISEDKKIFYQNLLNGLSQINKRVLIFNDNSREEIIRSQLILADLEIIDDNIREYISFSNKNKKHKIGFYRKDKTSTNLDSLIQDLLIIPDYVHGSELILNKIKDFYKSYNPNKIFICPDGEYTTKEIVKILRFAPVTIQRWFDRGYLKGKRSNILNRRRIVRGENLINFINEHEMTSYLNSKLYNIEDLSNISSIPARVLMNQFDSGRLKGFKLPLLSESRVERRIPKECFVEWIKNSNFSDECIRALFNEKDYEEFFTTTQDL